MGEIKFRAWLPSVKRMTYAHNLEDLMGWDVGPKERGTAVWLQYTGLYDDTGKEIFAGDIVRIQDKNETRAPYISEVYFNPSDGTFVDGHPSHLKAGAGLRYRELSGYCDYGDGGKVGVSCEIIGNIYENPELLKED